MDFVKPIIKRSHHVMVSEDGAICIGEIPGKSKIIKNAPEWIKVLLSKLDGNRTMPRIYKEMSALGFDVSDEDISSFVQKLASFRLLEENSRFSDLLSSEEIERYDRQILQFSLIDEDQVENATIYQERLKKSRVLIFGMGGWGTWCSLQLARSGIGTLRLVDGDDVELSNLNRQVLYTSEDVGKSKVAVAADAIHDHNPHVQVEQNPEFASLDERQILGFVEDVDLIILAWASLGYYRKHTVERLVHRIASEKHIPVIELGGDPLDISVGPVYLNDGSHPSFEDVRSNAQKAFYSNDDTVRKFQEARLKNNFRDGNRSVNAWQSSPSLGVMAGLVVDQAIKIITRYDKCNLVGKKFHLSLRTYISRQEVIFAKV